jgi:GNAT superfamily N-acetyltransferase
MRLEPGESPSPGIRLRDAAPGDAPFLKELYRSSREPELALTAWTEAQKSAFANSQFELQDRWYRENFPGVQFLMIERDGTAAGRLYVHSSESDVNLMDLTLAPSARNQGLGTALIRWLQCKAGAEGAAVSLHVEMFNPARALYRRLGFAEEGVEGVYVRMRWMPGATTGG